MKFSLLAPSLLVVASNLALAVSGQGVLNTLAEPKIVLYTGAEVAGVTTWDKANQFCQAKGRELSSVSEICLSRWSGSNQKFFEDVGPSTEEQWMPIRGKNNYMSMATLPGGDAGTNTMCKQFSEIYGPPPEPAPQQDTTHPVYCAKPPDCTDKTCHYECPHPKGYYPDPTDCRSYCYCSGGDGPSYYDTVEGDGNIWNPYCGATPTPLDKSYAPLGGMEGGCASESHYVDNKAYCDPALATAAPVAKETEAPRTDGLSKMGFPIDDDKTFDLANVDSFDKKVEAIACTIRPKEPDDPPHCGCIWGDPHLVTFDDKKYDCQGTGEFVLAKSLNSGFEVQAEFSGFEVNGVTHQATVTRSVVINTNSPDEPEVEMYYKSNRIFIKIDGNEVNVDSLWNWQGTMATGHEGAAFFSSGNDRHIYFPFSDIKIKVRKVNSSSMGRYINVCTCLPDSMVQSETIVGLFGSPDGNPDNDLLDPQGTPLANQESEWKAGYDYCMDNYCVENAADSLFSNPLSGAGQCDVPYDDSLELAVKNPDPELAKICGSNIGCLIEGAASGDTKDAIASVKELKELGTFVEPTDEDIDILDADNTFASNTQPPVSGGGGGANGDPHVKTWDGESFDFHGGCDLVLVKAAEFAKGLGLDIHIRTKIRTWWSYIDSAVLRIGYDTFELKGGQNTATFWINGKQQEITETTGGYIEVGSIAGYKIDFMNVSKRQKNFRLKLGNGDFISMQTFNDFVRIDVKAESDNFKNAVGLMGKFPHGQKLDREGSIMVDTDEFGKEWQVRRTEAQLFSSIEGVQHPEECQMPSETEVSARTSRRRLGEALITEEDAAIACARVNAADRDNCIFDVLATNSKEMAGSY